MNPLIPIAILALVQGITEFLPISSSGHLVLTWKIFDEAGAPVSQAEIDRLVLDIAVHVGTLGAVMLYYWRDVGRLFAGLGSCSGCASPTTGASCSISLRRPSRC